RATSPKKRAPPAPPTPPAASPSSTVSTPPAAAASASARRSSGDTKRASSTLQLGALEAASSAANTGGPIATIVNRGDATRLSQRAPSIGPSEGRSSAGTAGRARRGNPIAAGRALARAGPLIG